MNHHISATIVLTMPAIVANPYIQGVTKREGTPAKMRFAVLEQQTYQLIHGNFSKDDGTFQLYLSKSYGANRKVTVICFDDQQIYNAQIIDFIEPKT